MNHQDITDLLPLYELGGLDGESVTAIEHHLAEPCASCMAELQQWRELVGLLPLSVTPTGPDPAVKERLMARVHQDLSPKVIPLRPRRTRVVWVSVPLAAAAAVLLVIGILRYQDALTTAQNVSTIAQDTARTAAEQSARVQNLEALLAQAQEQLASREAELGQLSARLAERQTQGAAQEQALAQLETQLSEQRRLVGMREQELAQVRSSLAAGNAAAATVKSETVALQTELARQREAVAGRERELKELRLALESQRGVVEASVREMTQLRDTLARQRGVIEVLTTPGLRVGYLQRAKVGLSTQGHMLWNEGKKSWLFYAFGLPQPPAGKEYQVWFMTEKEGPVSAGLFTPDQNGTGVLLAAPPSKLFGDVQAAAITLEPAGGLLKPSGEMYLRGSL
jgi:hypothetical protein